MSLEAPICLSLQMDKELLGEAQMDDEELLEGLLDFCEEAAGIYSAVFYRTDFYPTRVFM